MITQTLNNIYQSGTTSDIDLAAHYAGLTSEQFYCVVVCATFILSVLIYMIISTIRGYVTKSCVGCRRLIQCEKDIKDIKIRQKTCGKNLGTIHKLLDDLLGENKN